MIIPKAIKLKNGDWLIRLRLGGAEQYITDPDKTRCERKARAAKSAYQADIRLQERVMKKPTLRVAIDKYISERQNSLSPATIRTYRNIQKNRFQDVMDRRLDTIKPRDWQGIVDRAYGQYATKTVKNSWGLIKSVLIANDAPFPEKITAPQTAKKRTAAWLEPDEIKAFVAAAKDDKYCIPMLLALMSMRISEIDALRWESISPDADFIETSGSRVMDEHGHWVEKDTQKTEASARRVPLLIPELRKAIREQHQDSGKVLNAHQMTLRRAVERTCKRAGVPRVTVHQLRHSFASLSAHLSIPKEISMEIGGWSNDKIMDEIYTHICRADIERYKNEMYYFYNPGARPVKDL